MKIRIDSVTMDLASQYVVHITCATDAGTFPVTPSGFCMVFKTKDEILALTNRVDEKPVTEAYKDALRSWVTVDPTLADLSKAAGKTSEDVKVAAPKGA